MIYCDFLILIFNKILKFGAISFVDISEMRYVRLILNLSVSILSELIDGLNGWLINPSHFSLNSLYSRKIAV